ncbi:hypothetical protein HX096_08495 [Empedobacter falsenii]|uniref:hypothetical protein n=1 Tax=Empedobacter falsenii TaxID=343874 RepID=UPI002575E6F7|nr:hypothetical protein [Empedobacter falsenii]MDM1547898.1 hypothetical protein [Empedobacter falsenii]
MVSLYDLNVISNYFAGASVAGATSLAAPSTLVAAESTLAAAESTTAAAESTVTAAESTLAGASSAFFSPQDTAPKDKAATATTAKNFFIVLLF